MANVNGAWVLNSAFNRAYLYEDTLASILVFDTEMPAEQSVNVSAV
jgi:hypothetical protein